MSRIKWLTSRPIAHRGLHDADAGIIENTLSAVEAALAAGYSIEVDLQASADNKAMVFHDALLSRLTKSDGLLAEYTCDELQKIQFKDTSDRMMTLEELLAFVGGRTPLFLEVKSDWKNVGPLEREIASLLLSYNGPVAIMSFDPNSVAVFRKIAPGIPRGIVAENFRQVKYWSFLAGWQKFGLRRLLHWLLRKPDFIACGVDNLFSLTPILTRFLFRKPLLAWTVRTESERKHADIFANNIIFENFKP